MKKNPKISFRKFNSQIKRLYAKVEVRYLFKEAGQKSQNSLFVVTNSEQKKYIVILLRGKNIPTVGSLFMIAKKLLFCPFKNYDIVFVLLLETTNKIVVFFWLLTCFSLIHCY